MLLAPASFTTEGASGHEEQVNFHWHKHDNEDEFFFVVAGKLLLDLEGETLELPPKQGYTVPRKVLHRTRAKEKTIVLMVEGSTVNPRGD